MRCNGTNTCITASFVCDGDNDCGDNEEELNCTGTDKYAIKTRLVRRIM